MTRQPTKPISKVFPNRTQVHLTPLLPPYPSNPKRNHAAAHCAPPNFYLPETSLDILNLSTTRSPPPRKLSNVPCAQENLPAMAIEGGIPECFTKLYWRFLQIPKQLANIVNVYLSQREWRKAINIIVFSVDHCIWKISRWPMYPQFVNNAGLNFSTSILWRSI